MKDDDIMDYFNSIEIEIPIGSYILKPWDDTHLQTMTHETLIQWDGVELL